MAGRHGRTSSMVIRSSWGLRTRAAAGLVSRPANVQKLIKEEQVKEVNKVSLKFIQAYEKRVANWSDNSKPQFVKVVTPRQPNQPLSMFIQTRGTEHQKKNFERLDRKGRPGGKFRIIAGLQRSTVGGDKRGPYQVRKLMQFKSGYKGKTAPVDQFGQRQLRFGPWQRRKTVVLGKITPRRFSDAIEKELKPSFRLAAKRGFRAGLERAGAK